MRLPVLTALGLLTCYKAPAQTSATIPVSQWGWGLRAGLGQATSQHGSARREYDETSATPMVGLVATRYFAGPLASLGIEALLTRTDIVVEYRKQDIAAPGFAYHPPQTLYQWRLFTPIYIRTSSPAKVLHLLAGAGPTFALGHPGDDAAYYARPAELTGMVGVEVRVLPWHCYEATLGIRVHAPLTPSYSYGVPDSYTASGGTSVAYEAHKNVFSRWIGFTLSTTLYPLPVR